MDLTCYTNEIEQIDSKQKEYEKDNDDDEEEENDEEDEESILAPSLKKNLLKVEEEFHSCINYAEPLHIFLKMKPFSRTELSGKQDQNCYQIYSDSFIRLNPPKSSAHSKNPMQAKKLSNTMFKFSFIFDAKISQKDFFMASIYPCINKLLSGDNLLVISYGVTNSGKTYTMQGTNSSPGIIPRTLDVFFSIMKENLDLKTAYKYKPDKFNEISLLSESELQQEIAYKEQLLKQCSLMKDYNHDNEAAANASSLLDTSKYCFSTESLSSIGTNYNVKDGDVMNNIKIPDDTKYTLWISFYELYNDQIYDLLVARARKDDKRNPLKIREDANRTPYVEGLIQVPVFNTYEAIRILKYGEKNLQKASNSINSNSSRSHAVFCIKIVSVSYGTTVRVNQLCFCDLAGIERISKTQAFGKLLNEAKTINSSLLALSRCINTLMYNQKNKTGQMQVPYRSNKLTRLFQAFFEGCGMIKMFVTINPSASCFDETVGVLKFSKIADKIQIHQHEDDRVTYKIGNETVNNGSVAWELDDNEALCEEIGADMEEDIEEVDEDADSVADDTFTEDEEDDGEEEEDDDIDDGDKEIEDDKMDVVNGDKESDKDDEDEETDDEEEDDDDEDEDEDEDESEDEVTMDEKEVTQQAKTIQEENFESITKDELIGMYKTVKTELKTFKETRLEKEMELRVEISTRWNGKMVERENYYKNQLKDQRGKIEEKYMQRLADMEKLLNLDYEEKINELEEKHKQEIEQTKTSAAVLARQMAASMARHEAFVQTENDEQLDELKRKLDDIECKYNVLLLTKLESDKKHSDEIDKLMRLHETKKIVSKFASTQTEEDQRLVDLKSKLNEIEALNKSLTLSKAELEQILEQYQQQVNQLKMRLNLADKQKNEADFKSMEWSSKYEKYVEQKQTEIKEYVQRLKEKQVEVDNLKAEIKHTSVSSEQYKTQIEEYSRIKSNLNNLLSERHAELAQMRRDAETSDNKCIKLKREYETLLQDNRTMADELNTKTLELNAVQKDLKQAFDTIDKLNERIDELKQANDDMKKQMTTDGNKENIANDVQHQVLQATREDQPQKRTSIRTSKYAKPAKISKTSLQEEIAEEEQTTATKAMATSVIDDSIEEIPAATAKALPTRKKSTLNRLTDLITKSPILESVRGRPSRQSKVKAATISTAADKQLIADVLMDKKAKEPNAKQTMTTKKASLMAAFNEEDTNDEPIDVDAAVSKAKRTIKKRK